VSAEYTTDVNGKSPLAAYVRAFEKVNGRTPSEDDNRRMLALIDVVRESGLEPFMAYHVANQGVQEAIDRLPVELRAVEKGIHKRLGAAVESLVEAQQLLKVEAKAGVELAPEALAAIETMVTRALAVPVEEAAPAWPWLAKVGDWLRARWPAAATIVARVSAAKWPIALMWASLALALLVAVSVTSAVAQRDRDGLIVRALSTPPGWAAMRLAEANPDLDRILRTCDRDGAVMTCRLRAIGSHAVSRPGPTRFSTVSAVVLDWVSSWPVEWVTVGLVLPWGIISALGFAKRGPAMKLVWRARRR
jgi:hypothetical protein